MDFTNERGCERERECDPVVYRSILPYLNSNGEWTFDCEEHERTHHTPWFFDAVGRALLHRSAAIR